MDDMVGNKAGLYVTKGPKVFRPSTALFNNCNPWFLPDEEKNILLAMPIVPVHAEPPFSRYCDLWN